MNAKTELAITLTPALFDHLTAEAGRLDIPLEWLVAALVVDTVGEGASEANVS